MAIAEENPTAHALPKLNHLCGFCRVLAWQLLQLYQHQTENADVTKETGEETELLFELLQLYLHSPKKSHYAILKLKPSQSQTDLDQCLLGSPPHKLA